MPPEGGGPLGGPPRGGPERGGGGAPRGGAMLNEPCELFRSIGASGRPMPPGAVKAGGGARGGGPRAPGSIVPPTPMPTALTARMALALADGGAPRGGGERPVDPGGMRPWPIWLEGES